jgi:hypothetical protein
LHGDAGAGAGVPQALEEARQRSLRRGIRDVLAAAPGGGDAAEAHDGGARSGQEMREQARRDGGDGGEVDVDEPRRLVGIEAAVVRGRDGTDREQHAVEAAELVGRGGDPLGAHSIRPRVSRHPPRSDPVPDREVRRRGAKVAILGGDQEEVMAGGGEARGERAPDARPTPRRSRTS